MFGADALHTRLSGQIATFLYDGQPEYCPDGRYTYTYSEDGGTAYGYWRIAEDGAVCVDFVNGFSGCDFYAMNGGRLLIPDASGAGFPARP